MAISTYSQLQSSIANFLHRTDLETVIPDFIALAETKFNRKFRVREMETAYTTTCVAGTAEIALPDDYLSLKNIQVLRNTKRCVGLDV